MTKQTCFVYCDCGHELCAGGRYTGPEDEHVETYECAKCGSRSRWLFSAPAPIRLRATHAGTQAAQTPTKEG